MANYYIIEKEVMPTRGLLYPPEAIIKARPLSIADIKFISSINPSNARIIINEIIERCTKCIGFDSSELYMADRDFIIFWLRANSFINSNGYCLDLEHCPYCNTPVHKNIKLEDFQVDYITQDKADIVLSTNDVINFKLPKMNAPAYIVEDEDIANILTYSNISEIYHTKDVEELTWRLLELPADDYASILNTANMMKCGIKDHMYVTCDKCLNKIPITMHINEAELFGKMNIMDILRIELQVCKYCGFQLNEDTPFTEVEMMQQIVGEMMKDEKEAMDKQKLSMPSFASLKSKLSSMHIK